jgi:hypothetical protein
MSAAGFASAAVGATFTTPTVNLLLSGDSVVANGLELPYTVSLPSAAGSGGQDVTITSNSGGLLLSTTAAGAGSSSITVNVAQGSSSTTFFVQGAANSGSGTITAAASGYSSASATLSLARAGVVIVPSVSGSAGSTGSAQLFFVYLDSTGTPQFDNTFLLGSNSVSVGVSSTNSSVASVPSSVTIQPGKGPGGVPITFGSSGSATITITQPAGFGTPNADQSGAVIVQ